MLGEQLQRAAEAGNGRGTVAGAQTGEPGAVIRVHRELSGVELAGTKSHFALEGEMGLSGVAAREANEAEQPVQPFCRSLLQVRLTVLDDRAFRSTSSRDRDRRERCGPSPLRSE